MIDFKIKNISIKISFSFFSLFAVLFYSNESSKILMALFSCILHEIGHILLMCLFKCPPRQLIFYGGGMKLTPNCRLISYKKEIAVLSAGCIINLVLGFLLIYINTFIEFAVANITLGLFNLLPFRAFDGGQIIKIIFDNLQNQNVLRYYGLALKFICGGLILMSIICMFKFKMSISLAVTICYIIVSEVMS